MKWNPTKFNKEHIELLQRPVKDNFCTVEEASILLNRNPRTVRFLIEKGWLFGSIKVGAAWLVCRASLDYYLEKIKQEGIFEPREITNEQQEIKT